MSYFKALWAALGATLLVAACGGGGDGGTNTNPARGELMQNPPPRIASMSAADFSAKLQASTSGQGLQQLAGTPVCGVDVQYIRYGTVGGTGEATHASGALLVPTGSAPQCTGARPIVLYAHGTNITKRYNLADFTDSTNPAYSEGQFLAALYAAQGYIVVAPNYAGYDSSSLGYHPYLNADQQSKDMMDALTAARKALPGLPSPTSASAKLFITGYSQGGHVAMATHRAMQAAGIPVTASAPMSGPYALAAQSDATFYGNVNAGGTVFTPLIFTSFQKAYGNLYSSPSDIYESAYATGIESLLPGIYDSTTVFSSGKLPQLALFSNTAPLPAYAAITPPTGTGATDALFAAGFGPANLIKNSARLSYLTDAATSPDGVVPAFTTGAPAANPQNPIRAAVKRNDLRGWTPTTPVLLCGGNGDPTVFYSLNTGVMGALWAPQVAARLVTVLDIDSAVGTSDPFAAAKVGFANAKAATIAAAGANAAAVVTASYHGGLVPPYCNAAARGFFSQF
ncbi:alpha/beta hydrolase family protein [Rhodoferax ferrireducens]|uniref:alpha/beta hydrolase family protein n=1 Tax=Rhodoferax ferrireducens TaxID=192843 RepID=UPI000E0CD830|nr:prolyl oligopeptidase family serine peptidase [Rhodoferax ferrireducens]